MTTPRENFEHNRARHRAAWYGDLPTTEREFVDALGDGLAQWVFDCVARKCRFYQSSKWAGFSACVYVPHKPTKLIVELFGEESAIRVCAAFGGEICHFSRNASFPKRGRNESILLLRKKGVAAIAIAEAFGVADTTVRRIVAGEALPPPLPRSKSPSRPRAPRRAPRSDHIRKRERNELMKRLRGGGVTAKELSRMFGVGEKYVYRVTGRFRQAGRSTGQI